MSRAWRLMKWQIGFMFATNFEFIPELKSIPRPGYCMRCETWTWLTNEVPAYSAHDGAYICEDCADDNDKDTEYAWAEYHSGCL